MNSLVELILARELILVNGSIQLLLGHTHVLTEVSNALTQGHYVHAPLRDIVGSLPHHDNKASCNLFPSGGFCLWFVKYAVSVKCYKVNFNK